MRRADWPDELAQVIYIDGFGNAMTGLAAPDTPERWWLKVAERRLSHARTFAEVTAGQAFWYAHADDLVAIGVNRGDAAAHLGLRIGSPVVLAPVGSGLPF
jgi:S-adenosylmethionine hydrolase